MPNTYTLIASNTVGSGGASLVSFSSIPATYTDLLVKVSTRSTNSAVFDVTYLKFNGSTSSFTNKILGGSGSAANSLSGTDGRFGVGDAATATSNTFSNIEVYIPNYASSNYKSFSSDSVQENNATEAYANLTAGLWSNTAAITSIDVYSAAHSFVQYSTFYLYGISKT
jgi:hypothetical protein